MVDISELAGFPPLSVVVIVRNGRNVNLNLSDYNAERDGEILLAYRPEEQRKLKFSVGCSATRRNACYLKTHIPTDVPIRQMKAGSLRDALSQSAGSSPEHKALLRAIVKAGGDRELAIRNVCRLYGVKALDALPAHVRNAVREMLLDET